MKLERRSNKSENIKFGWFKSHKWLHSHPNIIELNSKKKKSLNVERDKYAGELLFEIGFNLILI